MLGPTLKPHAAVFQFSRNGSNADVIRGKTHRFQLNSSVSNPDTCLFYTRNDKKSQLQYLDYIYYIYTTNELSDTLE